MLAFVKGCNCLQTGDMDSGKIIPKFKFWSTLWNVAKIAVIFSVVLVILCGVRWVTRWLGFAVSFERVFASFAPIAASAVWPCFLLIIIYLFKDNLETVAELIGKAWHGNQGAIQPSNGAKSEGEDDGRTADENAMGSESPRDFFIRKCRAFEKYALDRLQQEEGVLVQRHVRIFNSGYQFDGAFEKGDCVYGVEVKIRVDKEPLRRFLLRADGLYRDLPRLQRKCFRTLVCISMSDGGKGMENAMRKLSALREEVSVPVEFRFYPFEYNEEKLTHEGE